MTAKDFTRAKVYGVGAGSEGVDFVLTPSAYEIVGRVLNSETGQPLTDFELCRGTWWEARGAPHLYSGNIYEFKSFSTTDGRFRFDMQLDRKRGIKALLLVRAMNYSTAIEVLDVDSLESDEEVVVYVDPGGRVSGMVMDEAGEPVPEVAVYYQHVVRIRRIKTDRRG